MQILLPPECFKHAVDLQPIEIKNLLSSETFNKNITSAVDPAELHAKPHAEFSTLLNKIKNANQMDDLCIQICAYMETLSE